MNAQECEDIKIPGFYAHAGVVPECKPFARFHGNREVVIFFHGLTGSPHDFHSYVPAYEAAGYDVVVPLLPGHGSHISHLERLTYKELFIPFQPLNDYLRARYERVHLVGLSYGAVLTANLALRRPPDSVCFLAPAFYLTQNTEKKMRMVSRLHLYRFKGRAAKTTLSGKNFKQHPFTYAHVPFLAASDLHAHAQEIRAHMSGQNWRVFHAHGDSDETTKLDENKQFLLDTFTDYTFHSVPGGTHVLPRSVGANEAALQHLAWLKRV